MPRQEETAELDNLTIVGRREGPQLGFSKKIAKKPSLKSQNSSEWLGKTTTRPIGLTMSMRGHMTSLLPSGT